MKKTISSKEVADKIFDIAGNYIRFVIAEKIKTLDYMKKPIPDGVVWFIKNKE